MLISLYRPSDRFLGSFWGISGSEHGRPTADPGGNRRSAGGPSSAGSSIAVGHRSAELRLAVMPDGSSKALSVRRDIAQARSGTQVGVESWNPFARSNNFND